MELGALDTVSQTTTPSPSTQPEDDETGGRISAEIPFIVDAHNDLLLELEHRRFEDAPFARYWLGNLERGGVTLQVCPIFGSELEALPELILRRNLLQVAAFNRAVRENADRVVFVRTKGDLDAVDDGERIGLMLSIEGLEALGYETTLIDLFYDLGARMASMTWNRRNPFADGAAEPDGGGLSNLGRELVDRMAGLGMILDLAHTSKRTFWDALERTTGRVCVSHAACRGALDTPRNLSDDQLTALAERGGVLGMMLLPIVVDPKGYSLERAVDHIDHAVSVMGIDHVGLGADFIAQVWRALPMRTPPDSLLPDGMPMDASLDGFEGPEHYPRLVELLRQRGYEGQRLAAILGGNWLRLFRATLPT
jgi:membrane dipeptidase